MPNEEGLYQETPTTLAEQLERFIDRGWLNIVGGCCGTTEKHIRAIAEMAAGKKPRRPLESNHRAVYSGIEIIEAEDSTRPLIVGERTNVIGSRLFKSLVAAEQWEEATEIARRQVKSGAHIVDVCLQSTDREELNDIPPFYEQLIRKIKAPIMIDTTDPRGVELALTYCQGKSIINSINLEDGEEKFEKICPLARTYGAAVIVGCIDEDPVQAQAFTRERKLEVAQRSHKLLTEKFGIHAENIIFDPLVFPCATGDENYIGGAVETIEGIRLMKQTYSVRADGAGNFECVVRAAGGRARSGEFGFSVSLHEGGTGLGDCECGADWSASGRFLNTSASWPRICCSTSRPARFRTAHPHAELLRGAPADWRAANEGAEGGDQSISHRRDCRTFPRNRSAQERARGRFAAGPAAGELHHRRIERRAGGGSESQTGGKGRAAGRDQRAADGGDGRSGPALQQ